MKKRIKLIAVFLFCSRIISAQNPEPIYSFAKVSKSVSYYKEQKIAWQNELNKNPKNAFAWYNYYRVNRNIFRTDHTDNRTLAEKSKIEKQIVDDMEKQVPNSFEYNLCRWMIGGNSFEYISYLKKAEELGAGRTEHLSDMLGWGEVERNLDRRNKYAKKWYESGEMSPGFLYYNYNVIAGLKQNAIIITNGDNDTYPIWLLQAAKEIRKDVTVLNTSLLLIDGYRNKIFKELAIPDWDFRSVKLDSIKIFSLKNYQNEIVKHIASNKNNYPVYVNLSCGNEFTSAIQENLYLTGLAYEYSSTQIDNMAILQKNFEQVYTLDYLENYFYVDASDPIVKLLNGNYVVPMIKLYEHYRLSGDIQKAEKMKKTILTISKTCGQEKEIIDYFKNN
jgi:hypothetical protein